MGILTGLFSAAVILSPAAAYIPQLMKIRRTACDGFSSYVRISSYESPQPFRLSCIIVPYPI
jgi:hypothetical protein